tara:strand:- start:6619 stop:7848 length:1230 start_codon:yes stop_codon:yes gene_type:complete
MTRDTVIVTAGSFATSNVFGGHYRSASAIAQLLSDQYDVLLVNVGTKPSPVMKMPGQDTIFVHGCTGMPGPIRSRLKALMREHKVKAVVAFDQKVGEMFRPIARQLGTGFVLVKPGGGQPRLYYPKASHQVVFMQADKVWIDQNANSKRGVTVSQAAGRIFPPMQDLEAQNKLRQQISLHDEEIAIVRIGRIDEQYAAVSRAALALSDKLRRAGLPARTVLIGTPESAEEITTLNAIKSKEDAIITDDLFTNQASRLLSMFRYNVGTGRGFMEGCNIGQIMMCASKKSEHRLPLLVTDENFDLFFDQNFSPRIQPDCTPSQNEARIVELMSNQDRQQALISRSKKWFDTSFSAENSLQVYSAMIEGAACAPETLNVDHLYSEVHMRLSVVMDRIRIALYRHVAPSTKEW